MGGYAGIGRNLENIVDLSIDFDTSKIIRHQQNYLEEAKLVLYKTDSDFGIKLILTPILYLHIKTYPYNDGSPRESELIGGFEDKRPLSSVAEAEARIDYGLLQ